MDTTEGLPASADAALPSLPELSGAGTGTGTDAYVPAFSDDAAPPDLTGTEDGAAEATTEIELPDGWDQHPKVQALLQEQERGKRRQLATEFKADLERALNGELKRGDLNSALRPLYDLFQQKTQAATQQFTDPAIQRGMQVHDDLLKLLEDDHIAFDQRLDENPNLWSLWHDYEGLKRELGLPRKASAQQVHAAVLAQQRQEALREQAQGRGGLDLEEAFDDLRDDPDYRALSPEDWQAVAPQNFQGDPARVLRQMQKEAERRLQQATTRRRAGQEAARGRELNQQAQNARTAARAAPPTVGGTPPRGRSYETVFNEWLSAKEAGTLTPQQDQEFWQLKRARDGDRGASWLP